MGETLKNSPYLTIGFFTAPTWGPLVLCHFGQGGWGEALLGLAFLEESSKELKFLDFPGPRES